MSSKPQRRTHPKPTAEAGLPYASYAQIVRMLLPLTAKVCFYDDQGHALWISDGLEEPELRMHVEILLNRATRDPSHSATLNFSSSDHSQPTYVFPIRTPDTLLGAMVLVFRDLPANATYRRTETVERLLTPVLEILSHAWHSGAAIPVPVVESGANRPEPLATQHPAEEPTPLPALLRRTLSLATHRLQCAFGAVVVSERAFTLTHRASPEESDLAMNAAIESVRAPMLKLMQLRSDPLIVNGPANRDQATPFKFLIVPLRQKSKRLAALLMLFRPRQDRDFTSIDVSELMQIVACLSSSALDELAPEPAVPSPLAAIPTIDATTTLEPVRVEPTSSARTIPLVVTADATPSMDERIRAALREDRFDLYAQRISPLRDARRPARFEVFVRMKDADRLRPPASFFEAAEAATLMPDVDRWVIRRLLATLKAQAALVRSGQWEFCINLAAQSLVADRFSEFVVAEVCKSSIPPGLLVFEISESDALEHQYALEFLGARLRDVGCRIALDNCRAGLATFGPLHKWPVSCVKIDGSLIGKLQSHTRSESVVRAVAQLATSMGIETVAERVESSDVCNKLLDIGIDYAQGFHFGQPQPLASVFL